MAEGRESPARTALGSAARTTTGQGGAFKIQDVGSTLVAELAVTAASGTSPTLDVEIEWSMDGTNWYSASTPDTFTQQTTTGRVVDEFTIKGAYCRADYTIGGTTPSFTFEVNTLVV